MALARHWIAALVLIGASWLAHPLQAEDPSARVILVLDASGSMWGQIEGQAKIEIARGVIAGLLEDWDPNVELGLSAYGHRRKGDCSDIEILIPVSKADPQSFMDTVNAIKPRGKTPLSEAVRQAAEVLRYTEEKATVILVSDGKETCDADPCALGKELEESGADFTVHVVGFDVKKEERAGLQCLAEYTGGLFLTAEDASTLTTALGKAVERVKAQAQPGTTLVAVLSDGGTPVEVGVDWTVHEVGDAEETPGKEVATAAGGSVLLQLPTGRYVVEAGRANVSGRAVIDVDADKGSRHEINLNAGMVRLTAVTRKGAEPFTDSLAWDIFAFDADGEAADKPVDTGRANPQAFLLGPGRYLAVVRSGTAYAETEFTLEAGDAVEADVVLGLGEVLLTAVETEGAEPFKGSIRWRIYPVGADGKPAEKEVGYDIHNPTRFTLAAGRYLVRVTAGTGRAETNFEVEAGEVVEKTVVIGVGTLNLTAVETEGAEPFKGSIRWRIYPVGADGKPAEKEVGYDIHNPTRFTLAAGRYLVRVTAGTGRAETNFEVEAGEVVEKTVVIGVGTLNLTAVETEGAEPFKGSIRWRIYPVGADGKPAEKEVGYDIHNPTRFTLAAGRYLVRVTAGTGRAEAAVVLEAGEAVEKTVVIGVGTLNLTAVETEGAEPFKGSIRWRIYPVGADGKPAEKEVGYDIHNPTRFTLAAGRYLVRVTAGTGRAETNFEVEAGEVVEKTVVIGVGTLNLTAVETEGAEPFKGSIRWRIYPVGADGKPAEKEVGYDIHNPTRFTLAAGRYLVRVTAGTGRAEAAAEVKAGEIVERTLVLGVGTLRLTAVEKKGDKPFQGSVRWRIYPVGADGKPAEKEVGYDIYNPSRFTLAAGRYLVRVTAGGASGEAEVRLAAGETKDLEIVVPRP